MYYLDANFFVFARLLQDKKGEKAREILNEIARGKSAITSSLALDEVMWVFIKNQKKEEMRQVIEDIYAIPNLEIKEVPSVIPLQALEYMERYNLKPRDAFHIAIMRYYRVSQIVSDDADFDKVKEVKRIKL